MPAAGLPVCLVVITLMAFAWSLLLISSVIRIKMKWGYRVGVYLLQEVKSLLSTGHSKGLVQVEGKRKRLTMIGKTAEMAVICAS